MCLIVSNLVYLNERCRTCVSSWSASKNKLAFNDISQGQHKKEVQKKRPVAKTPKRERKTSANSFTVHSFLQCWLSRQQNADDLVLTKLPRHFCLSALMSRVALLKSSCSVRLILTKYRKYVIWKRVPYTSWPYIKTLNI